MGLTYRCPIFVKEWLSAIEGDEKFVMTVGCGLISALLVCFGVISGGEYVTVTLGTVAVYIGGKTAADVASSNSEAKIASFTSASSVAASKSDASIAKSTGEAPP